MTETISRLLREEKNENSTLSHTLATFSKHWFTPARGRNAQRVKNRQIKPQTQPSICTIVETP
jgi:hypothetical protein